MILDDMAMPSDEAVADMNNEYAKARARENVSLFARFFGIKRDDIDSTNMDICISKIDTIEEIYRIEIDMVDAIGWLANNAMMGMTKEMLSSLLTIKNRCIDSLKEIVKSEPHRQPIRARSWVDMVHRLLLSEYKLLALLDEVAVLHDIYVSEQSVAIMLIILSR